MSRADHTCGAWTSFQRRITPQTGWTCNPCRWRCGLRCPDRKRAVWLGSRICRCRPRFSRSDTCSFGSAPWSSSICPEFASCQWADSLSSCMCHRWPFPKQSFRMGKPRRPHGWHQAAPWPPPGRTWRQERHTFSNSSYHRHQATLSSY